MKKAFWSIFLISLFIKAFLAAKVPLTADEAYYWIWSHHLQWSYLDHPPFIAWLFYLGQPVEHLASLVRWPGVLLSHLSLLIWYFIIQRHFSQTNKVAWLTMSLISPMVGIGSAVITPDIPLIFFWSCSFWFFLEALSSQKRIWYILLGFSLGLGFCSKYNIVLFVPTAFLSLAFCKQLKLISWKNIFFTITCGLLASFPVIYWNYQNDFISFRYQSNHGLGGTQWNPSWTAEYILGQFILITPFLISVVWRVPKLKNPKMISRNLNLRILWIFFLTPLVFFFFSSFKGHVEMNWPLAAFLPMFVLTTQRDSYEKARWGYYFFWSPLVVIALFHLVYPILSWMPGKINEPYRYQKLIPEVDKTIPTFFGTYQMASYLWFTTKNPSYKLKGASRADFLDTFAESVPKTKEFIFFSHKDQGLPDWLAPQVKSDIKLKTIEPEFEIRRIHLK